MHSSYCRQPFAGCKQRGTHWFAYHQLFLTLQKIMLGLVTNFLCGVILYGTGDSAKWSMQVTVNKNRVIEIKQ